jgi:hypothetical protein
LTSAPRSSFGQSRKSDQIGFRVGNSEKVFRTEAHDVRHVLSSLGARRLLVNRQRSWLGCVNRAAKRDARGKNQRGRAHKTFLRECGSVVVVVFMSPTGLWAIISAKPECPRLQLAKAADPR